MIAEEVRRRLRELVEADDEEGGEGKRKPRKPETADADDAPSPKGDVPAGPRATAGSPDMGDDEADPEGPAVDGDQPDPEADQDEDDAVDSDGDAGEEPSGAVNDEVSGKTVQAVTIEPKSKVLPGAKEVVLAFNESTDTLRILITPTGQVKFFWRGQLHDIP
ncbi:MAG TPA: hypothetical protein VFT74_18775 [Isosphaeraceae bacterium]|nr:hypothetical protein [Isosphaeraceae bacterium]